MINYYYSDPVEKTTYYVPFEVENIVSLSETKIKNAISKKAVTALSNRIGTSSKEDIKELTKRIKKNIYVGQLIEGYSNIEVVGNFEKIVAEKEMITIITNSGIKEIEAEKLNSKVLTGAYIYKEYGQYRITYKGLLIINSKCKDVKKIDEKLINLTNIEKKVDNKLIELGYKVPKTKEQLGSYLDNLKEEKAYIEKTILRRDSKGINTNNLKNELNAINEEIELVNNMLGNKSVENTIVTDKQENAFKNYIVLDTQVNKDFKEKLIGKIYKGVESGEYVGLQVDNTTIWIIKSGTMEVNASNSKKMDIKIKQQFVKIKLLDKKINRLLDKRFIIKSDIVKQGIKLNNRENNLIQDLNNIDNVINSLDSKIDTVKTNINTLRQLLYNINLFILKAEYRANKYKIIDNNTNDIIHSNSIDNIINNYNFTIKVLINNTEYFKQRINKNSSPSYLTDSLCIIDYNKNDTQEKIIKEVYTDIKGDILYIQNTIKKSNIELCYTKNNVMNNYHMSINNISVNRCKQDTYEKALNLFKNDTEIYNHILEERNVIPYTQPKNKDRKNMFIKIYIEAVNKFPLLKEIADNIDYYNNIYKDNIKSFYKKYNTNSKNWSNYLYNYKTLKRLLELNTDNIGGEYKSPLDVVYTKKYRKI